MPKFKNNSNKRKAKEQLQLPNQSQLTDENNIDLLTIIKDHLSVIHSNETFLILEFKEQINWDFRIKIKNSLECDAKTKNINNFFCYIVTKFTFIKNYKETTFYDKLKNNFTISPITSNFLNKFYNENRFFDGKKILPQIKETLSKSTHNNIVLPEETTYKKIEELLGVKEKPSLNSKAELNSSSKMIVAKNKPYSKEDLEIQAILKTTNKEGPINSNNLASNHYFRPISNQLTKKIEPSQSCTDFAILDSEKLEEPTNKEIEEEFIKWCSS